ncbi:EAL domain-containing protein [Enterobacter hormaechei]|uniref:EAL domain-containing protein n=1 Tax=Enterobacter hormaechei TaxID=158836 RepID=UPI003D7E97E5
MLTSLREAGIPVALDDFGTGYPGLSCLEDLPGDYLKVESTFTARTDWVLWNWSTVNG